MDYKTLVVYAVIVIVVAGGVAYALTRTALAGNYSMSVSISGSVPSQVYPYQTSRFTISLNNTGSRTISQIPVVIYLNNNQYGSYKVTLPPKQSTTLPLNYTYTASGPYSFEVIADPGHLFDIANRSTAQATVSVNVSATQAPDVYSLLPNSSSTTGFTLFQNGSAVVAVTGLGYNLSVINTMFGPARSIMLRLLEDLSLTINTAYGAESRYPNNSVGYSIWLQGTLDPGLVGAIVRSFGLSQQSFNANGTQATYVKVSNTTSLCFYYSGGWTKAVSYYNSSDQASCKTLVGSAHPSNESAFLLSQYGSTPAMAAYLGNFVYTNSTNLGGSIGYQNGNITATNIFDNPYGTFIGYLRRNQVPANILVNQTCNGLVYNSGNISICSSFITPIKNGSISSYLINETLISQNYTAILYSFVNDSNLLAANQNGLSLILLLNLSQRTQGWNTVFKNLCNLSNVTFGCNVLSFNHSNDSTEFSITNNFQSSVRLNSLLCSLEPFQVPQIVNSTVLPGQSISLNTTCYNIPVPIASISTTYPLSVNYTVNGATNTVYGYANITNIQ